MMKRIITVLTVLCMIMALCPCAMAVQQDYISEMTMDEFSSYVDSTDDYKLTMSAAAYGSGVSFNGQGVASKWFVKEADNNIALSVPTVSDTFYRVQTSNGATGNVIASVRIKPLGEYDRFTVQIADSNNQPVCSLRIDPTSSGSKINYSDGDVGTTEYPSNMEVNYTAAPVNEWTTVEFSINTAARKYGVTLINTTNGTKNLFSDVKFRYYSDTTKAVNVARIPFAINRGISEWYSNGALLDDFRIYIDDPIASVSNVTDTVEVGGAYTLPEKVTAALASGAGYQASVVWNETAVDTSTIGEFDYTGTVTDSNGASFPVTLTLTVQPLSIAAVDDIAVYLGRGTEESLPEKVKVKYSNDSYGFENITWDTTPTLTETTETVTGTVDGWSEAVTATVYAYDTNTAVVDMNLQDYYEGYILRTNPWTLKTAVEMVATEFPAESGNMRMKYSRTVDDEGAISYGYACITAPEAAEGLYAASCDLYMPDDLSNFVVETLTFDNTKEVIEMFLKADGTVTVGDTSYTDLFETEEWFNLKFIANDETQTFDLFINNTLIAQNLAYKAEGSNAILRFGNLDKANTDFVAYGDNIRMYALSGILNDSADEMAFTDAPVTESLTLPVPSDENVTAVWSSSDEGVISSGGTVVRPAWGTGDKDVTLSVTLSKNIGAYTVSKTKDITLKVKEAAITDSQAVAAALENLTQATITDESADNITKDITLPLSAENGVTLSWTTSNSAVIDTAGKIYPTQSDTAVNLTVTAQKGSVSDIKTFTLTVKYQAELSDLQAVRSAMAALSIPSFTSGNLSLPASGDNGVSITWTSNNLSALANDGTYRNTGSEKTAVMTAILTKGDARDTKSFTVTVAAASSDGGSSGGGGGGGGGSRGGVMTAPIVTPAAEPETVKPLYSDIEGYAWASTAINTLTNAGVLTGTGEGRFEPARNVNREEYVAMAVRALDIEDAEGELPFTDVSENDWHYETTKKAWSAGLVSGMSDSSFGSGIEIKRQDMFVIMYNAAKKMNISLVKVRDAIEFTDGGEIAEYAKEAITALYECGIINGYGDTIAPNKSATRAEAAKMIYEMLQKID